MKLGERDIKVNLQELEEVKKYNIVYTQDILKNKEKVKHFTNNFKAIPKVTKKRYS